MNEYLLVRADTHDYSKVPPSQAKLRDEDSDPSKPPKDGARGGAWVRIGKG